MNETRQGGVWRLLNRLLGWPVCLLKGHQDFGTVFGQQCLRCGRESWLDLSDLAPPRLTCVGDPDRHRMDTGVLRASGVFDRPPGVPGNVQCAFVPEVSGDTYARAGGPATAEARRQAGMRPHLYDQLELTERGRQRLADIGWLKPGDTLKVELLSEDQVRRIVKTETERARALGLLSVQEERDRTRRRRMARNLDIIKPVKGVH